MGLIDGSVDGFNEGMDVGIIDGSIDGSCDLDTSFEGPAVGYNKLGLLYGWSFLMIEKTGERHV